MSNEIVNEDEEAKKKKKAKKKAKKEKAAKSAGFLSNIVSIITKLGGGG